MDPVINTPFHQDHRGGRSVTEPQQQPVSGDARHRRSSSTKARSKSAEVTPRAAPVSAVLPPRSYSADDRHAIDVLPPLTGGSFTSSFRKAGDSRMDGHITTGSIHESKNGVGVDSCRTAQRDEQEAFRNTENDAVTVKQDLLDTLGDESARDVSTNRIGCPLVAAESAQAPVAKTRLKVPPKVPQKPRRCPKKEVKDDEQEEAPPPFVSIFGLMVPTAVHGWMLRVKDEVKIVTATKRLRLDEADEVRIMEAELAVRTKARRKSALKAEQEERERRKAKAASEDFEASLVSYGNASETIFTHKKFFDSDVHTKHFLNEDHGPWKVAPNEDHRPWKVAPNDDHGPWKVAPNEDHVPWKIAPSDKPFRLKEEIASSLFVARHKRQASDPMIFSVAPRLLRNSDVGSIPTGFETLPRFDKSKATPERAAPQPIHLGVTVLTQRKTDVSPPTQVAGSQPTLLTENIPYSRSASSGGRLVGGSTGSLPVKLATSSEYRMEFYARECEALRKKKEKIDRLQREIDRRRQHLAETLRQCERLRIDACRGAPEAHPDEGLPSSSLPASGAADDDLDSKGLIRPIDYPIDPEKYYVKFEPSAPNPEHASDSSVYSSFEYIVHKTEHAQQRQHRRPDSAFRGVSSSPAWSSLPHCGQTRRRDSDSHNLSDAAPYSESEDPYYYSHGTYGSSSHDSGVSSTIAGTDTLPFREQTPPPAPPARPPPRSMGDRRRGTRPDHGPASYAPAGGTPPMPILDDVACRSRNVLRGMGSRPLSDDMEKYFHSEGEYWERF